jgi:hypothetical protein
MCYHASIHVGIKSLLLNFFFQSFNEIMSFSFNRVYAQALFIFLREFSYKSLRIHLVAPDIAAALKSILDCGKKKQIFGILFF